MDNLENMRDSVDDDRATPAESISPFSECDEDGSNNSRKQAEMTGELVTQDRDEQEVNPSKKANNGPNDDDDSTTFSKRLG